MASKSREFSFLEMLLLGNIKFVGKFRFSLKQCKVDSINCSHYGLINFKNVFYFALHHLRSQENIQLHNNAAPFVFLTTARTFIYERNRLDDAKMEITVKIVCVRN